MWGLVLEKVKTIGLITEGLDFNIPNGILTWVNTLLYTFPQFNFVIINLTNKVREKTKLKSIPPNLIDLMEVPIWSEGDSVPARSLNFPEVKLNGTKRHKDASKFLVSNAKFNKKFFARTIQRLTEYSYPAVDIYHAANGGLAGILGAMLKKKTKAKLVVSEHGSYYKEWVLRLNDKFFPSEIKFPKELSKVKKENVQTLETVKNISSFVFGYADSILPVTKAHIDTEKRLGAAPQKIRVIHNGFYIPELRYTPEEHLFQGDSVKIGFVGRINPIKGIDTLIKVADKLVEKSNKYEFHIYGPIDDYDYYTSCKGHIEDLGIEDKVIFHSFDWNSYKIFEKLDIFALPSYSEGLPFILMEALGFGLPVIASDVGGVKEVLDGFGVSIKSFKDANQWINKIDAVVENKKKVISHVKRQRDHTKMRFSISAFQRQMENIYSIPR